MQPDGQTASKTGCCRCDPVAFWRRSDCRSLAAVAWRPEWLSHSGIERFAKRRDVFHLCGFCQYVSRKHIEVAYEVLGAAIVECDRWDTTSEQTREGQTSTGQLRALRQFSMSRRHASPGLEAVSWSGVPGLKQGNTMSARLI